MSDPLAPRAVADVRSPLSDGEWHRLHPLTPVLRGGLFLIVVTGFVIANLRDRIVAWLLPGFDDWERYVTTDPRFFRPAEVDLLVGDATKAETKLGWKREVSFPDLVERMVVHDLAVERAKMESGR